MTFQSNLVNSITKRS